MKRLYSLCIVALMLLAFVPNVHAQATVNSTTLSTAITTPTPNTGPATSVTVASLGSGSTAIAVGNVLFIDGEAMIVTVIPTSGTTVTVRRAQLSTNAQTHPANALIYYGLPQYFASGVPGRQLYGGTCVAANQLANPVIDTVNRTFWNCDPISLIWGSWQLSAPFGTTLNYHGVLNVAYTVKPWDDIVAVTSMGNAAGTGSMVTLTLPSATGLKGKVLMFKDETGLPGTNLNTILLSINPNSGNTSGKILTGYGTLRLYSNGTSWYTAP